MSCCVQSLNTSSGLIDVCISDISEKSMLFFGQYQQDDVVSTGWNQVIHVTINDLGISFRVEERYVFCNAFFVLV